jgi:hypothetical protein
MSTTFTKLFSSITESTIWAEPDSVRIVWITMLAMADRHGRIWASIPGLANRARVSLSACEDALGRFQKPDKYSRTPDHEGRRIEPIDGGWRLLNHAKYRAIRDEESALEAKRKYAAKKRSETKLEKVDQSRSKANKVEPSRDNADADSDAEADSNTTPKPPRGQPVEPESFTTFWNAYPKKVAKPQALKSWLRIAPTKDTQAQIIQDVTKRKASEDWTKDQGKYIPNPSTYLNNQRWTDLFEIPETKETLHAKLTSHPANPKGTQCTHATEEEKADFKAMLYRYKAMP